MAKNSRWTAITIVQFDAKTTTASSQSKGLVLEVVGMNIIATMTTLLHILGPFTWKWVVFKPLSNYCCGKLREQDQNCGIMYA